jgi:hypothetical protein
VKNDCQNFTWKYIPEDNSENQKTAPSSLDLKIRVHNITITLQQICKQTPRYTIGDCAGGHRGDNREKNRDVLIVPRE